MLLVSLLGIQSFFRNTDKIKMVSIKIFIWAAARGRPPGRPLLIEEVPPGSLPRSQLDGPEIWAYWQAYIHTAHIRYQYTPNDHNLLVPHFMQTPVKYIFSESLRIVDYEGIFIKIKKLRLSEYSILIISPKYMYKGSLNKFVSGWIQVGERDQHCYMWPD